MNTNTLQWKLRDWLSLDFNTYVHQEPTNKNLLVNYSHSSISLSFDVLDGLFRQCPMYFNYLTARSCTIVLLLWKKKIILWNVVFLVKVIKFLWRGFLFSDRLRTVRESAWPNLCSVYCWGLAKFMEKKVFELSTHFQFSHSNSFILSRQVLCWPCFDCFSSYGRRRRRTPPFECIIQSTNI